MINQAKNAVSTNILHYSLAADERPIQYIVDLLVRERSEWAIELMVQVTGAGLCFEYPMEHWISLDSCRTNDLTLSNGLRLCQSICENLLTAYDHLIDFPLIRLDPGQILCEPKSGRTRLCVVPARKILPAQAETVGISDEGLNQSFINLIHSMGKAFSWPEALVNNLIPETNSKELPLLNLVQNVATALKIYSDHPSAVKFDSANHSFSGDKKITKIRLGFLKQALLPLFHGLMLLLSSLSFVNSAIIKNSYFQTITISFSVLLILFDLLYFRVPKRFLRVVSFFYNELKTGLKQPIYQLFQSKNVAAEKSGSPLGLRDQTVLLQAVQTHLRFGLLSEKFPGSPEELEGLRAYILVDEFVIGRDHRLCDFTLPSPAMGRRQARIIRREGVFFVADLGSKNGTSLDGRRLNKFEEYELPDQCRLEFADMSFYFSAS